MLSKREFFLTTVALIGMSIISSAQEGVVRVNQDDILPELLKLKTEMVKDSRIAERYRIQIFSGEYDKATAIKKEFDQLYTQWPSRREYETPNYKIWVGNFRNSLDADRALLEIKKNFPAAFRFKPEKK